LKTEKQQRQNTDDRAAIRKIGAGGSRSMLWCRALEINRKLKHKNNSLEISTTTTTTTTSLRRYGFHRSIQKTLLF